MTKVRLDRKLAEMLNGIDLSRANTGEELDVSEREAELLVAEGWASVVEHADERPARRRRGRARPGS